ISGNRAGHSICNPRARLIDRIVAAAARKTAIAFVRTYIPGRADASSKKMRLVVEPARIRKAVPSLQAHEELPCLSRTRQRFRLVPRELDSPRNVRIGARNVQVEAHLLLADIR